MRVHMIALGVSAIVSNAAAAQVVFSKIADNSMVAPGGTATFSSFRHASISGNTVAFTSSAFSPLDVFSATVGAPGASLVARPGSTAGSDGTFTSTGGPVSAISGDNIIFKGGTSSSPQGIYAGRVGAEGGVPVANWQTPWPSNPSINLQVFTGGPSVNGDNVVFAVRGTPTTANGIFTATIGSPGVSVIADSTTQVPGQSVTFDPDLAGLVDAGSPSISGDNVAFSGNWTGGAGIYTGTVGVRGATRIVDTTTPVPGGTGNFRLFGYPVVSGNNIAFSAGAGIYMGEVGVFGANRIVHSDTVIPGTNFTIGSFLNIAIGGDNVAFESARGILFVDDGVITPVILKGDMLFGSSVTFVHFGQQGYDDTTKQIVFDYELANGERGVATAYVGAVPEPASLSALLATSLLIRRRPHRA